MARLGGERMIVEGGPPCGNCAATTWDVGLIYGPLVQAAANAAFVDLRPALMARCVKCAWSQRLDRDEVPGRIPDEKGD